MDYIIEIDNRDLHTTELQIMTHQPAGGRTILGFELTVEVDPFELVENAIDNLPEDIAVSAVVLWNKFLEDLKKYTDWSDLVDREES